MFSMYNILSTFIIPMKGISKQTSDLLLFFSLNILFIHKNTGGFTRHAWNSACFAWNRKLSTKSELR